MARSLAPALLTRTRPRSWSGIATTAACSASRRRPLSDEDRQLREAERKIDELTMEVEVWRRGGVIVMEAVQRTGRSTPASDSKSRRCKSDRSSGPPAYFADDHHHRRHGDTYLSPPWWPRSRGLLLMISGIALSGVLAANLATFMLDRAEASARAVGVPVSTIAFGLTMAWSGEGTVGARSRQPSGSADIPRTPTAPSSGLPRAKSCGRVYETIGSSVGYTAERREIGSRFEGAALVLAAAAAAEIAAVVVATALTRRGNRWLER